MLKDLLRLFEATDRIRRIIAFVRGSPELVTGVLSLPIMFVAIHSYVQNQPLVASALSFLAGMLFGAVLHAVAWPKLFGRPIEVELLPLGEWFHLKVKNRRGPEEFTCQVEAVDGFLPVQTPFWSLKWRGYDGESRPIPGGSTALIDLAALETVRIDDYPDPGWIWRSGEFRLYSASARDGWPVSILHFINTQYPCAQSATLQVRLVGQKSGRSITKIIRFGFDEQANPRVKLDDAKR